MADVLQMCSVAGVAEVMQMCSRNVLQECAAEELSAFLASCPLAAVVFVTAVPLPVMVQSALRPAEGRMSAVARERPAPRCGYRQPPPPVNLTAALVVAALIE